MSSRGISGFFDEVSRRMVLYSDWMSPVLVKETRQALRSRGFFILFFLLLVFSTFVALVSLWHSRDASGAASEGAGRSLFLFLAYALTLVSVALVPIASARRLVHEKEMKSFELLRITTIRPGSILFGKLSGAALEIMLYFSAAAPCMILSYTLGGINLSAILLLLVLILIAGLASVVLAVTLASFVVESKKISQMPYFIYAIFILGFCLGSFGILEDIVRDIGPDIFSQSEFWLAASLMLGLLFILGGWLISVAKIPFMFQGANKTTPIKIWATLALVVVGVVGCVMTQSPAFRDAAPALCRFLIPFFVLNLLFLSGEPDEWSLRVKRDERLGRYKLLPLKSVFLPGGARSIAWFVFCLIVLLALDVSFQGALGKTHYLERAPLYYFVLISHGLISCGLPYLVIRGMLGIKDRPQLLRVTTVIWFGLLQFVLAFVLFFVMNQFRHYGSDEYYLWSGVTFWAEGFKSGEHPSFDRYYVFIPIFLGILIALLIFLRAFGRRADKAEPEEPPETLKAVEGEPE